MTDRFRSWRVLLRVALVTLRLERRRATLVLLPLIPLCFGITALAGRGIVHAATTGGRGGVVASSVVAGLGVLGCFVAIYWQVATGGMRLSEVTGVELDRQLLHSVTASPTVALFDEPEVLDRIELIRVNKQALATPIAVVRDVLWTSGNLLVSSLMLAAVDVRLAFLGALIVPVAWIYFRAEDISDRAERSMAGHRREALHLFDVGTGPEEGKEIRAFRQGDTLRTRYASTWDEVDTTLTRAYAVAAAVRVVAFAVVATVMGVLLVAVAHDIGAGELDAVDALLLVMGVAGLADVAGFAGFVASAARRALHVADHFATIVERTPAPTGSIPPPDRLARGVALHGVTFAYPGDDEPVLHDVSLHLAAGSTVAVVGENGAGKSTLVKLLCGLYDPDDGAVRVDGHDLRAVDRLAWAQRVALVAQDFTRFELVAREAVGVGDVRAMDDEGAVAAAVDRAGAATVVDALPDGLGTQLGGRFGGQDLSGGQWQRLAVARGMMRRAPLLLAMDEPTGALDARTEQELLTRCLEDSRALAREAGTVVVYVSHRYSTVRLADRIVVLERGRVVEDGTHADLLAAGGRYAGLYRRQADAYS